MSFDADLYRRTVKLAGRGEAGGVLTMSVVDAGPRDALRTIVFLHGMGGQVGHWQHQLGHFYEGSRVIAPDLRGHGLTDAPHSRYDIDELVADIEGLLEAVEAPPSFVLMAHSFGGALATVFTHRHPKRVDKLVIIGSAVRFDKLNNAGRFLLKAPQTSLSLVMRVLPAARRYPPGHVVHAQYRHALLPYDGSALLPTITCPTLVILGERDRLFDSRAYQAIAKLIPNAQEVTMPVSAHQVMVERPDAVNRAIERFLGPVQVAEEQAQRRARQRELEAERPWLKFYDGRTPYQIRPPQGPLQRHLEIAARRFARVAALRFLHGTINYKRLDRLSNSLADGLRKQGLLPGERVLILLPNIPQAVITYFATLKAGGVAVFQNPLATQAEVLERVAQVQAVLVVALSTRYDDLHQVLITAGVRRVAFTGMRDHMVWYDWLMFSIKHHYREGHPMPYLRKLVADRKVYRLREWMSLWYERPEPEPEVEDIALIQYSAATSTGQAKPVALSHRNLMANALQIRHWMPEARAGDERILAVWPFASGLAGTVNVAPMLGATVILVPRFEPMEVLQSIKRTRPTFMPGSPRMYQLLGQVPGVRKYGIASIRVCFSGGATLPVEVQEGFEKLTKGRVVVAYNTVEAGVCLGNPMAARKRSGSIGVPLSDVEARLVNQRTGKPCEVDEPGELWVRGPQVANQYWQDPTLTAATFRDGWFATGDIARRDADGFFYIVDRQTDVIVGDASTDQAEVYPKDIEEVLYELQEVGEVAVSSWTNDAGGTEVVAFVVPKGPSRDGTPSLDMKALARWCEQRLPADSQPTRYIAIKRLPLGPTGKVLRRELRHWGGQG